MKPIYTPFFRQPTKLLAIFAVLLMFPFAACGERNEQVDDPTETQEIPDATETISLSATLSGEPGGDPDGSGTANVTIDVDAMEVCYELEVSGIAEPTMAHIHQGAAGESGGVVVDFNMPVHGMSGCVTGVDAGVIDQIIENPDNFYVNVHNEDYPGGAVRGQLTTS